MNEYSFHNNHIDQIPALIIESEVQFSIKFNSWMNVYLFHINSYTDN